MNHNHEIGYIIADGLKMSMIYDKRNNVIIFQEYDTTGNAKYYDVSHIKVFFMQRIESLNFELRRGIDINDIKFVFDQVIDGTKTKYKVTWTIVESMTDTTPDICMIKGKLFYRDIEGKYSDMTLSKKSEKIVTDIFNEYLTSVR